MTKLYFKNAQELINFIKEFTNHLEFITINDITFYIKNCEITSSENSYIFIFDMNSTLICTIVVDKIKSLNEYKIIKEWD